MSFCLNLSLTLAFEFTCRELIFTEPKVLVSPFMEERNQLFLITPVSMIILRFLQN